jgi:SAM-dependent methyltransferase
MNGVAADHLRVESLELGGGKVESSGDRGLATPGALRSQPFDGYASEYDAALQQGLAVSGESKEYFAQGRISFLRQCLEKVRLQPARVLDFGCGTGTSVPLLGELPGVVTVQGIDLSGESVAQAKRLHGGPERRFCRTDEFVPQGQYDLAFCNGVFHHIPPAERGGAMETIHRALRPGGFFALWENNPWNPATRYVMSRIPFDQDAITLTPTEARQLLRSSGFDVLRTDFLFIFPRVLRWFRPLEKLISAWPLGTQYQVLCRKPA